METVVIRGDGSLEGPAVVDRLLTTLPARQERGRVEIDTRCSSRVIREIKFIGQDWITPGSFVEIEDAEKGRIPGIVIGISVAYDNSGFPDKIIRVETEA